MFIFEHLDMNNINPTSLYNSLQSNLDMMYSMMNGAYILMHVR